LATQSSIGTRGRRPPRHTDAGDSLDVTSLHSDAAA
jgi:hypothetical protein